ncbi:hypothetical protein, partial [Pontibacter korlensis]|uniref:hypothetical protein n=1 Tax=Pontibacter korlensis TaxID=400092 RepID=UPI0039F12594
RESRWPPTPTKGQQETIPLPLFLFIHPPGKGGIAAPTNWHGRHEGAAMRLEGQPKAWPQKSPRFRAEAFLLMGVL